MFCKKETPTQVFSCEICEIFLRTPILKNIYERLLPISFHTSNLHILATEMFNSLQPAVAQPSGGIEKQQRAVMSYPNSGWNVGQKGPLPYFTHVNSTKVGISSENFLNFNFKSFFTLL